MLLGAVLNPVLNPVDSSIISVSLVPIGADPDPEVHRLLIEKVFPRQAEVTTIDEWLKA